MSDTVERKLGKLTIRVDRPACIGSGNCVKVSPNVFQLDDEGIAAFTPDAENASREDILEACEVCPVEAFLVVDESGEQLIP